MSERPTDIIIGPFLWTISYDDAALQDAFDTDGEDRYGITKPRRHRIIVAVNSRPEQAIRETVLHELLHAIGETFHIRPSIEDKAYDQEEENVARLAAPLLSVIQDNPMLMRWLFKNEEA